jgi:hypothetical protein
MAAHAEDELQDGLIEIKTDRGRIDAESSKRAAVAAAIFAISWPGVFVMPLLTIGALASQRDPVWMLLGMLFAISVVPAITLATGYSIGWFAHYWFYETKMPPKRMATVIGLILDAVVFGWALVMVFSQ